MYIIIKDELLEQGSFTKDKRYNVIGMSVDSEWFKIVDDNREEDWIGNYMVKDILKN